MFFNVQVVAFCLLVWSSLTDACCLVDAIFHGKLLEDRFWPSTAIAIFVFLQCLDQ